MIVVIKKSNAILICLIFALLAAIYSLNLDAGNETIYGDGIVKEPKDGDIAVMKEGVAKRTVIVDAGHGGEDPGAVSDYSNLKEKDVNLKIAFKVKDLLEKENYNVIMTRTEDVLVYEPGTTEIYQKRKQDLLRRKKIMDESGADIVVSIHLNKFTETQYYGAQVFYPPDSNESRDLANYIQKALKEYADPTNKRVAMVKEPPAGQKPIIILRDIKTPTVIVECGFLSNAEEERKLRTEEYQDKLAYAIKEGINNYFKNRN